MQLTRSLALSFRDRACLALALILKAPVYTADKSWKNLKRPLEWLSEWLLKQSSMSPTSQA